MTTQEFFQTHRGAIFVALPHGSIKALERAMSKSRIAIERMFTNGWEPSYHHDLLRRSMLIIEACETNPDLVQRYKEFVVSPTPA